MRNSIRFAAAFLLINGASGNVGAQVGYDVASQSSHPFQASAPVAGTAPPRPYAFRDEPVMSINNSYLGYSNFVAEDYPTPRFITDRGIPRAPGYPQVPLQRGGHWFSRWRRNR